MIFSYITEKTVLDILPISKRTLEDWRAKKRYLPFYKLGRKVFYKRSDIEELMDSIVVQPIKKG